MHPEQFLDDLESQFAAEEEAERAALATEAQRLRLSRTGLRERLLALESAVVELVDGTAVPTAPVAVGADWFAAEADGGVERRVLLVPFAAVRGIRLSARPPRRPVTEPDALAARVSLGFALRVVARRRLAVSVGLVDGALLAGTVDAAGADHLELALHDAGAPRRAAQVAGWRILPFAALAWVRVLADDGVPGL